jgi:hypothetical protein
MTASAVSTPSSSASGLVVGADSDADPPGPGIDQVCGPPAPEDARLGVRLAGAPGDLPVRGGQGEHVGLAACGRSQSSGHHGLTG